jgi:hypothetical protein
MNDKDTASLPTQRSWMATYGPALILGLVILMVGGVIFSSVPTAVQPSPSPATPQLTAEEYAAKQTRDTDALVQGAVREAQGDWNKLSPQNQKRISDLSMGTRQRNDGDLLEPNAGREESKEKIASVRLAQHGGSRANQFRATAVYPFPDRRAGHDELPRGKPEAGW